MYLLLLIHLHLHLLLLLLLHVPRLRLSLLPDPILLRSNCTFDSHAAPVARFHGGLVALASAYGAYEPRARGACLFLLFLVARCHV